jgi:aminopeptidase N
MVPRSVYDPTLRRLEVIQIPVIISEVQSPSAPQLRELAVEVATAFEFMAGKFGPPPLRSLTVSPIPGAFGQGFPGLVYLSTMSYMRPEDRPPNASGSFQQTFFSDLLHAHEIAHQWWGNAVATSGGQDAWLMEALANYSALLYLEKRRGARALDSVLGEYRKRLLAQTPEGRSKESMGPVVWGSRLISSEAPDAQQTIVYEKGSWIMHMLRARLGDERFSAMLAELAKRYNRSIVTTDQFRLLAAKFMPPGAPDATLEVFFQNWVYSTGIPTLQMQSSVRGKAPAFVVTGIVTQSGVDEEFSAVVPVEIQFKTGKPVVQWVRTDSEPVRFSVDLKQAPVKVALDPSDSILATKK